MIRLTTATGLSKDAVFESDDADLIRVGRAESNELTLEDHHVSGHHASIVFNGQVYVLRDHHSTNGTRVLRKGERFSLDQEPGREFVLQSGDAIAFGEVASEVSVAVEIDEDEEGAAFVSVRQIEQLPDVEKTTPREMLQRLYAAQREFTGAVSVGEVIDAAAREVFAILPRATHVTVALREADESGKSKRSSRYIPIGSRVRGGSDGGPIAISRSVFKKVVKDRAAVLAADARSEVGETASIMAAQILSTIGVPLWEGEDIIGVLQVDNRDGEGIFRASDLDVLALLAQSVSQAFGRARLIDQLRVAEERQRTENVYLKRREERRRFDGIIGESRAMTTLFDQIHKVVDTRVTVLIEGETGTGKELVASALHYWSNRRDKLFVAQNCAAMPENLLESELFGHTKGSFTGATNDKKGLFELAHEGTLFLDEIGEMALSLQAKLLRVLQEGEVRPVGASRPKRVDTRIVAATNRDLETEVKEGRFREDLYYRLKVFPLRLPPLRERAGDISLIATHFLARYTEEFGRHVAGFGQEAMEAMQRYAWPGNVRELQNEVQRLVIQVDDESFVEPRHLSDKVVSREGGSSLDVSSVSGTLKEMVEEFEKAVLSDALEDHEGNKTATAKTLGITREGLYKKLKGYGM